MTANSLLLGANRTWRMKQNFLHVNAPPSILAFFWTQLIGPSLCCVWRCFIWLKSQRKAGYHVMTDKRRISAVDRIWNRDHASTTTVADHSVSKRCYIVIYGRWKFKQYGWTSCVLPDGSPSCLSNTRQDFSLPSSDRLPRHPYSIQCYKRIRHVQNLSFIIINLCDTHASETTTSKETRKILMSD